MQLKTEQVKASLRSSIVEGRYSPGNRLPTFMEMEGDFEVGRAVIQNAIEELKRDGFVRSDGRRGLFVTQNPPHLYQYGLVLPAIPGDAGWCQLMSALHNEAHQLERTDPERRFRFYYGITQGCDGAKSLEQLQDDIQNHRLAGLVIHRASAEAIQDVLRQASGLPRVFLWADEKFGVSPCLTCDGDELLRRSLRWLKEKGCKRIGIVHMSGTYVTCDHAALFADAGLDYHPPLVQWVGRSDPQTAERLVSLMFDYQRSMRPDGLIVADDNLVTHVSSGLMGCGIKIGNELQLVTHCNWPWPARSMLPTVRIGFDIRALLQRSIATIGQQQEGAGFEHYQFIPPLFEWEIDGPPARA